MRSGIILASRYLTPQFKSGYSEPGRISASLDPLYSQYRQPQSSLNLLRDFEALMAPSIAITEQKSLLGWSKTGSKNAALPLLPPPEDDVLRRRNDELEREVKLGREMEEWLRWELEKLRARLRVAEEAEERLCVQLGELEAESAEQAREYQQRIRELNRELEKAKRIISSSSSLSTES